VRKEKFLKEITLNDENIFKTQFLNRQAKSPLDLLQEVIIKGNKIKKKMNFYKNF
jgi:hypothetical protein